MKRGNFNSLVIGGVLGIIICSQVPAAQEAQRQKQEELMRSIIKSERQIEYLKETDAYDADLFLQKQEEISKKQEEEFLRLREEENKKQIADDIQLLAAVAYSEEEEFINYFNSEKTVAVELNGKYAVIPKKEAAEMAFRYAMAVVINRCKNNVGGTTIEEVIMAEGAYATTTKQKLDRQDIPKRIYDMAEEMLTTVEDELPDNLIYQGEIEWGTPIFKIGNQKFGIDEKYE